MLADDTEVFGKDGFNAVALSYFKNYESSYTEAEKAKLDALMNKYASLYDEYVNVIVEDTKEESLYDSFDKIKRLLIKIALYSMIALPPILNILCSMVTINFNRCFYSQSFGSQHQAQK